METTSERLQIVTWLHRSSKLTVVIDSVEVISTKHGDTSWLWKPDGSLESLVAINSATSEQVKPLGLPTPSPLPSNPDAGFRSAC